MQRELEFSLSRLFPAVEDTFDTAQQCFITVPAMLATRSKSVNVSPFLHGTVKTATN